jgi:hypothetical protein
VLGDPLHGLADSKLKYFLEVPGIDPPAPAPSQWRRIFDALSCGQQTQGSGEPVVALINPERYIRPGETECAGELRLRFTWRLNALNRALGPAGDVIGPERQVVPSPDKPGREVAERRRERWGLAVAEDLRLYGPCWWSPSVWRLAR